MSEGHEAVAEKKAGILRITINLTVTCLISGAILAAAYFLTHPIAVEQTKKLETMSMQELVPDASSFKAVEGHEGMFAAEKDGAVAAYVVSEAPKGYGGAIKMLVAVTKDGKVIDFTITGSNETPGLGSKAAETPFKDQFPGKTADQLVVTKDQANKTQVQAMTGATISSKAVTKGVKDAVDAVAALTGGK
jgi:electron transport complex protein RnfG